MQLGELVQIETDEQFAKKLVSKMNESNLVEAKIE